MIKVLIVDDDSFIRESLKVLVGLDPEIEVAGTAGMALKRSLCWGRQAAGLMSHSWISGCRGAAVWKAHA